METTSTAGKNPSGAERDEQTGPRPIDGFLMAGFPWYGLDAAYSGTRWLGQPGLSADGVVEHGPLGHGDRPSLMAALPMADPEADRQRFCVVVTLGDRPVRASADGSGTLEATSVSSAAWLAGSGLLSTTWPGRMDRALRADWLEQQTTIAWELADDLDGDAWTTLSLPVDDVPTDFRYRESEYGWVLAGSVDGAHLGAYGRGMSAYGLGMARVLDLTAYDGAL